MELCRGLYEYGGAENARLGNAGPSRNASSLCYVCVVKWTIISSEGIGVILSCFLVNTLLLRTFVDDLRYGPASVRLSVCLSRRSTAAAACGWFAAVRRRVRPISIDIRRAAHALSSKMLGRRRHVETAGFS